jgi:hypothetical protein
MRFKQTTGVAALALALILLLTSCDTRSGPSFGSLTILLTDAPGEVVEAWVTIQDIYFQGRGGEEDPPGGRVYLLEGAAETHELLSLANTVAEVVVDQEVPAGTYGQLRVVLSGGCLVTDAGKVYASPGYGECGAADGHLHMPSMAQTGVKVLLHGFTVTEGQQTLLLDFDVSQSFGKAAGASGQWVMNPVIHGAEISLTSVVVATLSAGEVDLPVGYALGDFTAILTSDEGDASEASFALAGGVYRATFRYLIPEKGPFELALKAPDGLVVEVDPTSPGTVEPGAGQTVRVDWVLQSAEVVAD